MPISGRFLEPLKDAIAVGRAHGLCLPRIDHRDQPEAEGVAMRTYRGVWSVGLVLGLAGCAGTRQGLVETDPTGSPIRSRLLAWRSGSAAPAPTTVARSNAVAARAATESLQASTAAAAVAPPKTADAKVTVQQLSRTGRLLT